MPRSLQPDRQLFGVTLALCLIGAVMVFSASAMTARDEYGNAYYFLLRQLLWIALGIAGMFWLMNFGLSQAAPAASDLYRAVRYVGAVDRRVFSRSFARDASLDSPGPAELAAFGTRQTRADLLSGVVSRDPARRRKASGVNNSTQTLAPRSAPCF